MGVIIMSKKPLTPLQAMTKISNENKSLMQNADSNIIIFIDPNKIKNWEFHDRPENELGDVESLAKELKEVGQQQPCIVRRIKNDPDFQYEVIAGERRWRASKIAGIDLQVIVKDIPDDEAAIVQFSENSNRKDLSDYAKARSYSTLIKSGLISQKDLVKKLNLSKMQVSRMLSFDRIPDDVKASIGDLSNLSFRSASQISQICSKGNEYKNAIIAISNKIRLGKLGHTKITQLVENQLLEKSSRPPAEKIQSENGTHILTWRSDNNMKQSIHFSKEISALLSSKPKLISIINKEIMKCISA